MVTGRFGAPLVPRQKAKNVLISLCKATLAARRARDVTQVQETPAFPGRPWLYTGLMVPVTKLGAGPRPVAQRYNARASLGGADLFTDHPTFTAVRRDRVGAMGGGTAWQTTAGAAATSSREAACERGPKRRPRGKRHRHTATTKAAFTQI